MDVANGGGDPASLNSRLPRLNSAGKRTVLDTYAGPKARL